MWPIKNDLAFWRGMTNNTVQHCKRGGFSSHITKLEMFVGSEVSTAAIPLAACQFLQTLWRQSSAPFPPAHCTFHKPKGENSLTQGNCVKVHVWAAIEQMYNFPVAFLTPPQFVSEPYLRNTHNTLPQNFLVRVWARAEPEQQRRTEGN